MLRQSDQTSLERRRPVDIDQQPFGIAAKLGNGFGEMTAGIIRPDQPYDQDLGLETTQACCDVASTTGTPFESGLAVDCQHRDRRVRTQSLGGTANRFIQHEVADQENPPSVESGNGINESGTGSFRRLVSNGFHISKGTRRRKKKGVHSGPCPLSATIARRIVRASRSIRRPLLF